MSKLRKYATALGLAATLFVSGTALAAPRRDDPTSGDLISRIKTFVIKILEDARPTFPGT